MGGKFGSPSRTGTSSSRTAKKGRVNQAEARQMERRGRRLIVEGRALLAQAAQLRGGPPPFRPSEAMIRALAKPGKPITMANLAAELNRQLSARHGSISAVARDLDTYRVQIRRWARSLDIPLENRDA